MPSCSLDAGLSRTGPQPSDVVAAHSPFGSRTGARRAAVCITGQLRALPITYLNLVRGPLLSLLSAHDAAVDVFLVTSNSSSFATWEQFVASLNLSDLAVVGPQVRFVREWPATWSHRESASTGLAFNLAAYPRYTDKKHATSLVQQWQLQKCRELITRHESRTGVRFTLAARIRTDAHFSAQLYGAPISNRSEGHDTARKWWLPPFTTPADPTPAPLNASVVASYMRCVGLHAGARPEAGTQADIDAGTQADSSEQCASRVGLARAREALLHACTRAPSRLRGCYGQAEWREWRQRRSGQTATTGTCLAPVTRSWTACSVGSNCCGGRVDRRGRCAG